MKMNMKKSIRDPGPEDSNALRTARARRTISWPIRVGLDAGRVECGSRAAAGPSDLARARIA